MDKDSKPTREKVKARRCTGGKAPRKQLSAKTKRLILKNKENENPVFQFPSRKRDLFTAVLTSDSEPEVEKRKTFTPVNRPKRRFTPGLAPRKLLSCRWRHYLIPESSDESDDDKDVEHDTLTDESRQKPPAARKKAADDFVKSPAVVKLRKYARLAD